MEDLPGSIRHEKEIKDKSIGEIIKQSQFVGSIIIHSENPKEPLKKIPELVNESKSRKVTE